MPQDQTIKQFSNFTKGLNTEASPLDFPEEFSLDEDNMELNIDGSRQRRRGVQFETNGAEIQTASASAAVTMKFFKWDNADNITANSIGVVQVGAFLHFIDLTKDNPSANILNLGSAPIVFLKLSGFLTTGTITTPKLSFASLDGVLLITSSDFKAPIRLDYDTVTDTITATTITIQVRDLWGVDDFLDVDEEQTGALSDEHEYNLLNQGWTSANITTWALPSPSNAHVMFLGKDAAGAWTEAQLRLTFFGNSPAPKGKFIIDFFTRGPDRETASGTTGLPADTETGRVSAVTTNFGRVFWAGINSNITTPDDKSPNGSSMILFTQIVETSEQYGQCYQEADPTAEAIFNLVDSDGGHINIPELGTVIELVPLNNQIIILATNGVWSIIAENGIFTPTTYQVKKITNIGASGADSAVLVEGTLSYWSESGIYQLELNDISQQPKAEDVTLKTIKTFYNGISTTAKENAKGYYDAIRKQIGWLYNDKPNWDFTLLPDHCNRELVFDFQLGAFYTHTHSQKSLKSPYVVGAVTGQNTVTNSVTESVEVNADQVQVNGVDVEVSTSNTIQTVTKSKYLTFVPRIGGLANFTLSSYQDEDFLDWDTEDYSSFFESGYFTFEDWARNKGVPFLIMHFERTEDGFDAQLNALHQSSCFVQARWEWNNSALGNRWGPEFQVYRYRLPYVPVDSSDTFDTGQRLLTTRSKLRGRGKAISLYIRSETGKDLKLYGFALKVTGGVNV